MIDAGSDATIGDALETFAKGATTLHVGCYLDNVPLQRKESQIVADAVKVIDAASATGRDVLLSFLDHGDEGIRVTAAGGLWQIHPEIVIPLPETMERLSITEAGQTAMLMLMTKGRINPCGSNPRFPNLRRRAEPKPLARRSGSARGNLIGCQQALRRFR